MVYEPLLTALLSIPVLIPIALRVPLDDTLTALLYVALLLVGVLPSVV
jgi:hypothetical protein